MQSGLLLKMDINQFVYIKRMSPFSRAIELDFMFNFYFISKFSSSIRNVVFPFICPFFQVSVTYFTQMLHSRTRCSFQNVGGWFVVGPHRLPSAICAKITHLYNVEYFYFVLEFSFSTRVHTILLVFFFCYSIGVFNSFFGYFIHMPFLLIVP